MNNEFVKLHVTVRIKKNNNNVIRQHHLCIVLKFLTKNWRIIKEKYSVLKNDN